MESSVKSLSRKSDNFKDAASCALGQDSTKMNTALQAHNFDTDTQRLSQNVGHSGYSHARPARQ